MSADPAVIKASPQKRPKKRRLSQTSVINGGGDVNGAAAGSGNEASDGEAAAAGPAKKKGGAGRAAVPANFTTDGPVEYRYSSEIAQMIYVFTEIEEPAIETVHMIEDVVRSQVVELLCRARCISHLRSSRFLTIDDLIFLIREERGKVNRLRNYLSWKEVRKKAKSDDAATGGAGADIDVDDFDVAEKKPPKKTVIKLPWELFPTFQDVLQALRNKRIDAGLAAGDSDEEADDDELEAYEDSIQRLRDADAVTRRMSKEQYVKYSECRQASFTFRKAKRFRDFINTSAYLDLKPNEDVMDVLGFLSFEMVRSLCMAALDIRNASAGIDPSKVLVFGGTTKKASSTTTENGQPAVNGESTSSSDDPSGDGSAAKDVVDFDDRPTERTERETAMAKLNLKYPLLPMHVMAAFARIQRESTRRRGRGLQNWQGGARRNRIALI